MTAAVAPSKAKAKTSPSEAPSEAPSGKTIQGTRLLGETLAFLGVSMEGGELTLVDTEEAFLIHQGGSRSSKTFSIAQGLCLLMLAHLRLGRPLQIDICRDSLPFLKKSAMRDMFTNMRAFGLYNEKFHNKTDHRHVIPLPGGGEVAADFYSLSGKEGEQKVRGGSRDVLWLNECNEVSEAKHAQLSMRTRWKRIYDFNPDVPADFWVFKNIIQNVKAQQRGIRHVISTYKDNPFLPPDQVAEIEMNVPVYEEPGGRLVEDWTLTYTGEGKQVSGNAHLWAVFGLGLLGQREGQVLPFALVDTLPEGADRGYGGDFGFSRPAAIIDVRETPGAFYLSEVLYKKGLTNAEMIQEAKRQEMDPFFPVIFDSASPERIKAWRQAGFRAGPCADKRGLHDRAMNHLFSKPVYVTRHSANLQRELGGWYFPSADDKPKRLTTMTNSGLFEKTMTAYGDHLIDGLLYFVGTVLKPRQSIATVGRALIRV